MSEGKVVNVFCAPHCATEGCEFQVTVRDGRAVQLRQHPKMRYPACAKGRTMIHRLYHPDRLLYPMKRVGERGEGKWQRISWDEALDTVAQKLNEAKEKYGNESVVMYHYVARHGLPDGIVGPRATVLRLFNLWGGCIPAYHRGSLCHRAIIEASKCLYGTRMVALPPDDECKLIIIWGTNPAETFVRGQMRSFLDAKSQGTRFVVVDPQYTATAAQLADEWLPIKPGTDTALALAMMNIIIQEGLYDTDMIFEHTNAPFLVRSDNGRMLREQDVLSGGSDKYMVWDTLTRGIRTYDTPGVRPAISGAYAWDGIECKPVWQRVVENVREWTPERAEGITDIPADTIRRIAKGVGGMRPAKIFLSMGPGLQRASWAENTIYALSSLNVITGNFRGAFVSPVPGAYYLREVGLERTVAGLEVENPVTKRIPINHLAEAILNPSRYGTNIRALFVMYGNPVNQNANSAKTIQALKKLDFIAVCDMFMSSTARYADILLPVNTFLERSSILDGCELPRGSYYHLYSLSPKSQLFFSDKAVESLGESKDDFEIICSLARIMGYGQHFPWKDAEEWIAEVLEIAKKNPKFPWLKNVTMDQLKRDGVVDVDMPPPTLTWDLATPSGRVELYSESLLERGYDPIPIYREPEEGPVSTPDLYAKYPLSLVTPHCLWRAHSSFANQPELSKRYHPGVLIHPADALKRNIKDGDKVIVFNDRGSIQLKAAVAGKIKPGVVRVYEGNWHESGMNNLLTSDRLTTYGENPTFNTCLVEVKRAEIAENDGSYRKRL